MGGKEKSTLLTDKSIAFLLYIQTNDYTLLCTLKKCIVCILVKDDVYVVKIFLKKFLVHNIYRQKTVEKRGPSIHVRCIRQCIFKRYLNNCCKWQLRRLSEKRENDCFVFVFS